MSILFIQTGGTIDKEYEEGAKAYNFIITNPAVERILAQVSPTFKYRIISMTRKDSMDLTDEDRKAIVAACEEASENRIVITHGTDTMAATGRALSVITDKVIVLTGALRPERFYNSDAAFNIGTAVGALQTLSNGIYVAMSGRVLPWDQYTKHPKTGQFMGSKEQPDLFL
jgi:L-asparaginase